LSPNEETIEEVYRLARRAEHEQLRRRLHDDVSWRPASTAKWKECTTPDEVVRTLLWRAEANRLRPGPMIDVGDRVLVHYKLTFDPDGERRVLTQTVVCSVFGGLVGRMDLVCSGFRAEP